METFIIAMPVPSMGATVNELTIISLKVQAGATVTKGQRLAEIESDKSIFDFESPCDGRLTALRVRAGDVCPVGAPFLEFETADVSLRHLAAAAGGTSASAPAQAAAPATLIWTPRATRMAQEAGLDPATITDMPATGPGGRVSGDDVAHYLAARKS